MTTAFSIILTTYNGKSSLPETLDSLRSNHIPREGVELLLVDNGSDDATHEILLAFVAAHGGRILQEPRRGKSYGLNRALDEAVGTCLVFIDDDVRLDPNWLLAWQDAAQAYPDAVVFGGQIRPDWTAPPEDWQSYLTDRGRSEGCTPLDQQEGVMRPNQVKGANMMVRRAGIGACRFDVKDSNFDGSAASHGGEDTNFALSVAPKDGQCIFVPRAIAYHRVDPQEMTLGAIYARYVRIGKVTGQRPGAKRPLGIGILLRALRFALYQISGRRGKAALLLTKIATQIGQRQTARKG